MKLGLLLGSLLLLSGTVNAALINSFEGTYDEVNGRVLFSFNVDTQDGTTASGIDNMYLDFDEFDLWTSGWSLLGATTSNTSTNYFDEDEMFLNFDTVTGSGVDIQFLFGGVNLAGFDTVTFSNDFAFNWSAYGSTLGETQILNNVADQTSWSAATLGPRIASVPAPSILVSLMLGLVGIGFTRRKRK